MKILSRRWWAIAIGALAVADVAVPASGAFAGPGAATAPARPGMGLNSRQIDEVQAFNLAATRPTC